MKTFFRCICCFLCVAGVFSLRGAEHIDILRGEENKVHCGFVFGNRYGTVGFLNPSTSSSRVYPDDFNVIPRKNMQGKRAADEHEARVRLFFRPDIRLRTVGRRPMVIHGKKKLGVGKTQKRGQLFAYICPRQQQGRSDDYCDHAGRPRRNVCGIYGEKYRYFRFYSQ